MKSFDVVIIGAGAAGLMCAISAGKRKLSVLIIDHAKNVGEKIRISGGGRCNFINLNVKPTNFLSQNPNFCISALKRFTSHDFIQLVEKHKISYHEKTLGQLFCDNSSKQIIEMLLAQCKEGDVEIWTETNAQRIEKNDEGFVIATNKENLVCKSLVIATGGLSIPKMGATDFGYKVAKQFGLNIIPPTPALVPLVLKPDLLEETKNLAGVAVCEVTATCNKKTFKEAILFTHKGLSGPVILQISSYWQENQTIIINFAPKIDVLSLLLEEKSRNPKKEISNLLNTILPKSLVGYLIKKADCKGFLAEISNQKLKVLANSINNWQVIPESTEGFAKAEVTLGGIDTDEISSKSFESKKVPGLFFIGEVLDVTGHLGGYNFAWAWSSGFAAGEFV